MENQDRIFDKTFYLDPENIWNWYENRNAFFDGIKGFNICSYDIENPKSSRVVLGVVGKSGKMLRGGIGIELSVFVKAVIELLEFLGYTVEKNA